MGFKIIIFDGHEKSLLLEVISKNEIHKTISELLQKRQSENKSASLTNLTQETQSSADELKKFKELLDSGVISQEEFDAIKEQLLDLQYKAVGHDALLLCF